MLAHQGGWDEAVFVALPLLLFFGMLQVAKRRADRESAAEQGQGNMAAGRAAVEPGDQPPE